jgi:hypothetical protein
MHTNTLTTGHYKGTLILDSISASRTFDGHFLLMINAHAKPEPLITTQWRLHWLGDAAEQFCEKYESRLTSGSLLHVRCSHLSAFDGRGCKQAPQIHARVQFMGLHATTPQATQPQPKQEPAAA